MQGWSGAGKSTLARQIASVIDADIFSTDDLFVADGVYKFDPTKLGVFHKLTLDKCIKAMKDGKNVICDNTNIECWQCRGYVAAAIDMGITVKFVRAEGNFQNLHGVPSEKVAMMKSKLEFLTVEDCLIAKAPWEK
jgi:predicted kinase